MWQFLRAYVKSMRLYYSFVTGIAGWIGVAYYEYIANSAHRTIEVPASPGRKLVILLILFLSWGVNQIINDYLGRKEDAINAPDRPMVTGELDPRKALGLSLLLLLLAAGVTVVYLEPVAVIFLLIGVLLNVLYEYAKGHGVLGNVVFGLMITMAPLYGGYASGPTQNTVLLPHRMSVLAIIWVMNALMTFYTYFKDFEGDRAAGKATLVVRLGRGRARVLGVFAALLPSLLFLVFRLTGLHRTPLNETFYILGALTVFLQVWTGVLYFLQPRGERTYSSLRTNFRACVCGQAAMIAIFEPDLAIWLFLGSYIFVGFLFELHANPRS